MNIAILGAGAWGTALAIALAGRHAVTLWARDPEQAAALSATRSNPRYLPEAVLPESLEVTADFALALAPAALLIIATPTAGLRPLAESILRLRPAGRSQTPIVWLCKGFEEGTGLLAHQVVEEVFASGLPMCGALSGPSFAIEVAQGLPCALTLASRDASFARRTAAELHGGRLRVYYTTDLTGVEIGGAVKNVLAIAVGISDGMRLGQNARAALVTRGLAEIQRLGVALEAAPETIMGLTGAGDLILTATGTLSRNRRVGLELAAGKPLVDILDGLGHVAEGVRSAREVLALAAARGVDMPITRAVNAVLAGSLSPEAAVQMLLARDPTSEG